MVSINEIFAKTSLNTSRACVAETKCRWSNHSLMTMVLTPVGHRDNV